MPGKVVQAEPNPSASVAEKKFSFFPAWLWCGIYGEEIPKSAAQGMFCDTQRSRKVGRAAWQVAGMERKEKPNPGIAQCLLLLFPAHEVGLAGLGIVSTSPSALTQHPEPLLSRLSRRLLASHPGGKAQPCPSASCQLLTPKAGGAKPLSWVIHGASRHMAHAGDWILPWFISDNCSCLHRLRM